jgi:hypothetical protein
MCKICNGKKEIEVLVIGIDTEWIECPYCIKTERQNKIQKIWEIINLNTKF